MTLTSVLVFRKIMSRASLILLKVGIPNLVGESTWDGGVSHTIFGSL